MRFQELDFLWEDDMGDIFGRTIDRMKRELGIVDPRPDEDTDPEGAAAWDREYGGEYDPETGQIIQGIEDTPDAGGSVSASGVNASQDLITMLKGFEGYGAKVDPSQGDRSDVVPYWDVQQWSIGYGSYAGSRNRSRRPNIRWTPQEAEEQLRTQLVPYRENVEAINRAGGYRWTPEQLDALTSFAYNIGSINELTANATRSNRTIAQKMLEYNQAGGRRLRGLIDRRRIERQKFLNGMADGRIDYQPSRSA